MQIIIPPALDGCLLRTYLTGELGLSHRLIIHLKKIPSGILLDGRPVTVRAVLRAGNVLTLAIEDGEEDVSHGIIPQGTLPPILYEDEDVLVCNKPADMPTHPSHGHFDDTLANAVLAYNLEKTGTAGTFRPVNRLDRQTSGAVLIAKHRIAAARLSAAMQRGEIQKTYLAVLEGVPHPPSGSILSPIRRAEKSVILRQICGSGNEGAHKAHTDYALLAHWQTPCGSPRSLVQAHPRTGRTHQLRVHFASIGAPIAGDTLYGLAASADQPPRQCLHAAALTFCHPMTGKRLTVRAPLPEDILSFVPSEARTLINT